VFTGWNLHRTRREGGPPASATSDPSFFEFFYDASQHDTGSKTFSFPIYPDGGTTIPARSPDGGMQDGLDLIDALARNPNTGRYLAAKLYRFFVSEFRPPDPAFVDRIASAYFANQYDMRAVVREVFLSPQFWDDRSFFARYSWPVEFVVRAMKEIGWNGFSVDNARAAMFAMGQELYAPPDVAGWAAGRTWFASGMMLARMNFASTLSTNQRFILAARAQSAAATPESLLSFFLTELRAAPMDTAVRSELLGYLRGTGQWTASTTQIQDKSAGLAHLIAGSPEYQLN